MEINEKIALIGRTIPTFTCIFIAIVSNLGNLTLTVLGFIIIFCSFVMVYIAEKKGANNEGDK